MFGNMHNISIANGGCAFLIVLSCLFTAIASPQIQTNIFAEYAGEWEGIFYVYSPDGTLIKRLKAHHIYRIVDKYTLEGTQTVMYPDGTIEKIEARDYIENGKLYCRVESDRSGIKILQGRLDGSQIFWNRNDSETLETFRERIINGKTYAIDGYGIYGKDHPKVYTFFAEYKRVR